MLFKSMLTLTILAVLTISILMLSGCANENPDLTWDEYLQMVKNNTFEGDIKSVSLEFNQAQAFGYISVDAERDGQFYQLTIAIPYTLTPHGPYSTQFYNPKDYEDLDLLYKGLEKSKKIRIPSSVPFDLNTKTVYYRFIYLDGDKIPFIDDKSHS